MIPYARAKSSLLLVSVLISPVVLSQWAPRLPAGTPLDAAGQPNLEAPTPRTPDGTPDLTGVWQRASAPAAGTAPAGADTPPVAGFADIGQNIEGGAPLRPEARALLEARRANDGAENPEAFCLPMGILQFHTQGAPRKFVQTPDLLVILYEASMGIRQIFTDGREPPGEDAFPWWYGYSVGRWEGDTLVVETTRLRDGGWLDIFGTPLTDAAKITERFTRVNFGTMSIDITIDDPKAYTRPWTVRVNQELMPDQELIEFVCLENQRFGRWETD